MRPILRFGAAGTGVNRQNGVIGVQFAGQEQFDPHRGQARLQPAQLCRELHLQASVTTLACKFQQRADIAHFCFEFLPLLQLPLDRRFFSAYGSRGAGIIPEVRLAHLRFKFLQLRRHMSEVKDAPVIPRLDLPGRARDLRLPLTCHDPPCFSQAGVMAVMTGSLLRKYPNRHKSAQSITQA